MTAKPKPLTAIDADHIASDLAWAKAHNYPPTMTPYQAASLLNVAMLAREYLAAYRTMDAEQKEPMSIDKVERAGQYIKCHRAEVATDNALNALAEALGEKQQS